jgi:hypothetical protein
VRTQRPHAPLLAHRPRMCRQAQAWRRGKKDPLIRWGSGATARGQGSDSCGYGTALWAAPTIVRNGGRHDMHNGRGHDRVSKTLPAASQQWWNRPRCRAGESPTAAARDVGSRR